MAWPNTGAKCMKVETVRSDRLLPGFFRFGAVMGRECASSLRADAEALFY